ncbi:MAG: LysR family transcriptional regulator [Acidobacteria bacterium]|nr:LysR family transcriptional regulator [Acidobacteriota bacterium]
MDFHDLKVFCDLIESGRFSRAADTNYISQSAVSQLIKKLEDYYEVKLLERGREAISPTAKGQIFYRHAKELLNEFGQLENDLKPSGEISGLVKVATVYSLGLHEMSHYVRRFMKRYPGVNLHLEYQRTNRIYEECLKNVIDVGIVPYPSPRPQLEIVPFFNDRLVLISAPGGPLAKRRQISIKDLDNQRFIGFERDIPIRKAVDRIFRAEKVGVQYVMQFDNIETIKCAVEVGFGVSIIPELAVREEIKAKTLVAVPFSQAFYRPVGIIFKKGRSLTTGAVAFIEFLQEEGKRHRAVK